MADPSPSDACQPASEITSAFRPQDLPAAIRLPVETETGEDLLGLVCEQARKAGGEMLFELPGVMFGEQEARAAALQGSDEDQLCFLVVSGDGNSINAITAEEAPSAVLQFAAAYAQVLRLIASDNRITGQLAH